MDESKLSWAFLAAAILALGWGAWLKINQPEEQEKAAKEIEWARLPSGKLVQKETREPFQGVREIPFELSPDVIEWEYTYVDGIRNGPALEHYFDPSKKRLKSSATYIDGVRQGAVITYNERGGKLSQGTVVDGAIEGIVTYFDVDGIVTDRRVFKGGIPSSEPAITESQVLTAEELDGEALDASVDLDDLADVPLMLDAEGNPYTGTQIGTYYGAAKAFEHNYKNGRDHGMYQAWDVDGNPEFQRPYLDGRKHGEWKHWADGSKLIIEENFHHSLQVSVAKRWHPNGKRRMESNFVHGAEHGIRKVFGSGGRPRRETTFDHGQQTHMIEWNFDGSVSREESTPLPEGQARTIPASTDPVSKTIELTDLLTVEEGEITIGFRYRLSTEEPDPPAQAARPFRASLIRNGDIEAFFDFDGELGGWRFNPWIVDFSPDETLAIQIDAEPGDLQIDIAGAGEIPDLYEPEVPAEAEESPETGEESE